MEPYWSVTTFRVRYAETDQMRVVYYANYLIWFEVGRAELCRDYGFNYSDMEREDGLCIIVAEARCRYKAPARYDDEIEVRTCLREARKRVLIFNYEVYRKSDAQLLAEGETTHVVTDLEGRPSSLPEKYAARFRRGPVNAQASQPD